MVRARRKEPSLIPFWTYLMHQFSDIVHQSFIDYTETEDWDEKLFMRHEHQATLYAVFLMTQHEIPSNDRIQCVTKDMVRFLDIHNFQAAELLWCSFDIWKSEVESEEQIATLFF